MKEASYHHGNLPQELLRLGLEALEREGAEALSLRGLAEQAGVSKTAPYRHFKDKNDFLGALADEGFRILHGDLSGVLEGTGPDLGAMGRAYMDFAVARPALYRLMNSPLVCSRPEVRMAWARKALLLLGNALAELRSAGGGMDSSATAAAWAYIHGLVLLRIDGLFPPQLPEPDWDRLAASFPVPEASP